MEGRHLWMLMLFKNNGACSEINGAASEFGYLSNMEFYSSHSIEMDSFQCLKKATKPSCSVAVNDVAMIERIL